MYSYLLEKYARFLADSRPPKSYKGQTHEPKDWEKLLYMMDSTTITLFDNILKGVGRHPKSGKKKGGMKVHTLMKYHVGVPICHTWVIKALRRVIPVTAGYEKDHLYVHKKGQFALTPLFVALVAIGMIDIMFALDSIPAIYGITHEPYIVFTTNAFALLGLRQMYFLLDGLLDRLVYLPYGLGAILGFIGIKLILHALHENKLGFINGGESVHVPEIPTFTSLIVIVSILVIAVLASLLKSKRSEVQGAIPVKWNKEYDDDDIASDEKRMQSIRKVVHPDKDDR